LAKINRFTQCIRYTVTRADGVNISVYGRRIPLVTPPTLQNKSVVPSNISNRLDALAFNAYNDATLYWAICDVNSEPNPFSLLKAGKPVVYIPPAKVIGSYLLSERSTN
jgi:hypothetical protein